VPRSLFLLSRVDRLSNGPGPRARAPSRSRSIIEADGLGAIPVAVGWTSVSAALTRVAHRRCHRAIGRARQGGSTQLKAAPPRACRTADAAEKQKWAPGIRLFLPGTFFGKKVAGTCSGYCLKNQVGIPPVILLPTSLRDTGGIDNERWPVFREYSDPRSTIERLCGWT